MKRILLFTLCLAMLLSVVGCAVPGSSEPTPPATEPDHQLRQVRQMKPTRRTRKKAPMWKMQRSVICMHLKLAR